MLVPWGDLMAAQPNQSMKSPATAQLAPNRDGGATRHSCCLRSDRATAGRAGAKEPGPTSENRTSQEGLGAFAHHWYRQDPTTAFTSCRGRNPREW